MQTFSFQLNNHFYTNQSLIKTLSIINNYLTTNGDSPLPQITSDSTGEIINSEFFLINNTPYKFESLFELIPYINKFNTIKYNNQIVWQNTSN